MLRRFYSAMVWVGIPMFLAGCELESYRSVSWAWAVWAAVVLLSLAGDRAEAAKRQRRDLKTFDRELRRYQRHDRESSKTKIR